MPLDARWQVLVGDCRDVLASLDAGSVQTCITSPPYFGLRDYGHDGQIGLEQTPDAFVAALVDVFRAVRRVLRDDGTVWLNLGDSYAGNAGGAQGPSGDRATRTFTGSMSGVRGGDGLKPKDLIGVPWMVAFALRADGWYLRSEIIWHKPNPMPESVTDRPTKAHEQVFLLSKSPRYFYDADAIREGDDVYHRKGTAQGHKLTRMDGYKGIAGGTLARDPDEPYGFARDITTVGRNKRSVWTVATQPFAGAHFATFPPALVEPCVLAGAPKGGTVLDPFNGAGTTGLVAVRNQREYIGIELNPAYAELARERIATDIRLGHRSPQRVDVDPAQASIFDDPTQEARHAA